MKAAKNVMKYTYYWLYDVVKDATKRFYNDPKNALMELFLGAFLGGVVATFLLVLMLWSGNIQAAEQQLVCQNYGYTDKAEDFHSIKTLPLVSTFKMVGGDVVFGDVTFKSVNPEMVGLEGLAITYYLDTEEKILYFYTNDEGQREVGISHVEKDSDTVFGDKSVFTNCAFEKPRKQQIAGTVVRANNTSGAKLPVFTF